METRTIQVKQHHIDKGEPGDCYTCPISRAVAEQILHLDGRMVRVGTKGVEIGRVGDSDYQHWHLAMDGETFMHDFDHGNGVGPTEVTLYR